MANGIHCDNPKCDTWVRMDNIKDAGFYTIFDGVYPSDAYYVGHFCSWDCIMTYAALKEPMEKFEL